MRITINDRKAPRSKTGLKAVRSLFRKRAGGSQVPGSLSGKKIHSKIKPSRCELGRGEGVWKTKFLLPRENTRKGGGKKIKKNLKPKGK